MPVAVTNAEDLEKELDIAEEEEGEEGKTLASILYRQTDDTQCIVKITPTRHNPHDSFMSCSVLSK